MRVAVLGGGGFRTPLVIEALSRRRQEIGVDEVVLQDLDPARLRLMAAVLEGLPGIAAGPRIRVTTDLDDALRGSDVIFAAIRVGGTSGRIADERSALELGVLGQETVGAGGLRYAMRTLPVMLDIAGRISDIAPRAWLLNFTNPAGMITEALQPILGGRVVGVCDSPVGLVRRACRALGVDPASVRADYVGINHLGWLRALRTTSGDRLADLLTDPRLLATTEEGRLFGPDLPRLLGVLPNEYLAFYYGHRELTDRLRSGPTRGEVIDDDQRNFYRTAPGDPTGAFAAWRAARLRREQSYLAEARDADRDTADLAGGGYQNVAVDLMAGIAGSSAPEVIVNCRNGSAVPQLPADMMLELPGSVSADGVTPHPVAGPLSPHQLGLICSVRAAERTMIDAVRHRSRELARLAFLLHPLVGSPSVAERLVHGAIAERPELATLFG